MRSAAEIAAGTNSRLFDLTGDGLVDIADLDEWRVQGGAACIPAIPTCQATPTWTVPSTRPTSTSGIATG